MAFVLERLGEDAGSMLAIGDGTNDIEMLTMAREAGGCVFSHAVLFL